jgi:hypothetical protein
MLRANQKRQHGFTLVEMLVIAPIALLVITGFVVIMVTMVGDVIVTRGQNAMTYDIQSALDTIQNDVRLSTEFLDTSGTLPTPQGKNGNTSAFTSTGGDLILGEIATDKNPIDPTRSFTYYNTPFSCSSPTEVYRNRIFFTTVTYTVRNNSLWRRTYVPDPSGTLCQSPWQVNTCAPGYSSGATRCQANDSEILKNIKTFTISYYTNPEDTVAIAASAATSASSIRVFLEAEQTVAGRTFSTSSSGRSTKLSAQDVTLAPPDAPTITATRSGNDAIFSWASVPTASSYLVQYSVTGNGTNTGWITASENSPDTIFSIPANNGDTVSIKVRARNTTGVSAETSASTTIPLWTDCNLQNGWVNYGSGYATCGYTITKDGVVILKGQLKDGSTASNTNLFQLPENMRPSHTYMFQTANSLMGSARIDVRAAGWVRFAGGGTNDNVSLDGIYFIPNNTLYSWTDLSLLNSWTNFNGGFAPLRYTQDASQRVHVVGMVVQGTFAQGTPIAQLPAGLAPDKYYMFPGRSGNTNVNQTAIDSSGQVLARGISASYVSHQIMFYPATYTSWTNFSAVAGTPGNDQLGNGWVLYSSTYATPGYTKSADGIVTVRGLIKDGSTSDNITIAKLPVGYRPSERLTFSVTTHSGMGYAGRVDVDTNGYLRYRNNGSGTNTWISLSNISFVADQ